MTELRRELLGCWSLVSFELSTEEGEVTRPFGAAPQGRLIYLDSGIMSAHLMARDRAPLAPGPREELAQRALSAVRSHFSYTGRWWVEGDEVFHEVDISVSPDWVGEIKARRIAFDGPDLVLTEEVMRLGRRTGSGRLRWRRDG